MVSCFFHIPLFISERVPWGVVNNQSWGSSLVVICEADHSGMLRDIHIYQQAPILRGIDKAQHLFYALIQVRTLISIISKDFTERGNIP